MKRAARPRQTWLRGAWERWSARRATDGTPVRQAWTASGDAGADEARAGSLLRQAIVREPMSDTQLAAVRARLRHDRLPPGSGARLAQIAVGLSVMLLAGALLAAAGRFLGWPVPVPIRRDVLTAAEPRSAQRLARAYSAAETTRAPASPIPSAVTPGSVASDPGRSIPPARFATPERIAVPRPTARARTEVAFAQPPAHAARPAAAEQPPPPAAVEQRPPSSGTSPLAEESRLLGLALRELRQDNDPAAALTTLDEHARRFGVAGALAVEADTARVEALLRLGRHADALVRLDGLALSATGSSRGLLAARAELRAEQGRCAAAVIDFDRLLARGGDNDRIVERAFHGRAGCRAQTGDVAGARADLETYLARFPDGRFATEARMTLHR